MARRIVIVGNGEVAPELAADIDASDMVVRFNNCASYGAGGLKTDVVAVCNTGRPGKAMSRSPDWRMLPAVQAASEIWSVREAAKFDEMMPDVLTRHPELDDFFEDFTGDFARIAAEDGKAHHVISREVHENLDCDLKGLTETPYVCPSSGLVAIAHVLSAIRQPGDEVLIAGFSHQGWELHPFDAERTLIERWIAKGDLARLR